MYQNTFRNFIIEENYLNKTSKNLAYNQIGLRYKLDDFSVGYAIRHNKGIPHNNMVVAYSNPGLDIDLFIVAINVNMGSKITTNFHTTDYTVNIRSRVALATTLDVFAKMNLEKAGDIFIPQLKFGIEFSSPSITKKKG